MSNHDALISQPFPTAIWETRDYRERQRLIASQHRKIKVALGDKFPDFWGTGDPYPKTLPAHGDRWGNFSFNRDVLVLTYEPASYEIDLERCCTSAQVLDWIFQLGNKSWLSVADKGDMIDALQDILWPQNSLCSFGHNKMIKNIADYIRSRTTDEIEVTWEVKANGQRKEIPATRDAKEAA